MLTHVSTTSYESDGHLVLYIFSHLPVSAERDVAVSFALTWLDVPLGVQCLKCMSSLGHWYHS